MTTVERFLPWALPHINNYLDEYGSRMFYFGIFRFKLQKNNKKIKKFNSNMLESVEWHDICMYNIERKKPFLVHTA